MVIKPGRHTLIAALFHLRQDIIPIILKFANTHTQTHAQRPNYLTGCYFEPTPDISFSSFFIILFVVGLASSLRRAS